ncbi:helix-turn-helix domain-containing protein [Falsarthrobacter nasiphocae]|uniref:DNA-binding CsgD family transcriptional regulator/uncharacterized protein YfiM (DUF2279 family) n=1 Tax=Falsarthrobacter nasiphocae TaxID=189863 RepID=A0AAE3YIN8_9MICC|nr:helix-turn-helix domain-containing protein [Falsarthrobacter nasiphocae]MDR6892879.1 DNA-binding CsgD family transcriptional regulator/uncharacterized protein YfiM (DUF2279 family) [Falsarthrobacter nasiphocae]
MSAAVPSGQDRTAALLRAHLGLISTSALAALDEQLTWYRGLRPKERSRLGLVAQRGIAAFAEWYAAPSETARWSVDDILAQAPSDMTRAISLLQALELVRVVVEAVEKCVPAVVSTEDEARLREAVLRYSRDIAFSVADVYARAAESRGAWDTRLEALVVDAIIRGESSDALTSRVAAVGFAAHQPLTILVGRSPAEAETDGLGAVRRRVSAHAGDCLVGLQGDRLVLVASGLRSPERALPELAACFGAGPVVVGPVARGLAEASASARAALSGLSAAPAWPEAPRPVSSEALLPERMLAGDQAAGKKLVAEVSAPLAALPGLEETLASYLATGRSLEATSRALFVHSNTVRYRLKRIAEVTGLDPFGPREAFVLQIGLVAGRLSGAPPVAL